MQDIHSDHADLVEYVRLPDEMPPNGEVASYDIHGQPVEDGPVTIYTLGVNFIWTVFSRRLRAGQVGIMTVSNIPSAFVMDGAATEWNRSTNKPTFGPAVITLLTVERGVGVGRVSCQNASDEDVWVATGIGVPISPARMLEAALAKG